MNDRYLPTIKQIIEKADSLGDRPMSDIESQWWFEETCRRNQEALEREVDHEHR